MKALLFCCAVCLPLRHLHINSPYGNRVHPVTGRRAFHQGVDLKAHHDTVYAIAAGEVTSVSFNHLFGIWIGVRHNGLVSLYGHLSRVLVAAGQHVEAGTQIAITGATGRVTGEHLHFSLIFDHRYINPIKFLYHMLIQKP